MAHPGPTSSPSRIVGLKRNIGGLEIGDLGAHPHAQRQRNQHERHAEPVVWPLAARLGKQQPLKGARPRQGAGSGCSHTQLDQQRDQNKRIGHDFNVQHRMLGIGCRIDRESAG